MDNEARSDHSSNEILEYHFSQFRLTWEHWNQSKQLPPVVIFVGPKGAGKESLIRYISEMLQCHQGRFQEDNSLSLFGPPSSGENKPILQKPCGKCPSCLKASTNSWVDYVTIESEKNTEGKPTRIKLEALEVIQKKMGFRAHESAFQIFHIKDAEQMTHQASNSLLKILEEPPEGWVFFLSCSDTNLLLPTLRSRAQIVRLKSIPDDVLDKALKTEGAPDSKRQIAIRLASGDLNKAREILLVENWELRQKVFLFIFDPKKHMSELLELAQKKPRSLEFIMDQLETIVHDLLLEDQRKWINLDFGEQIRKYQKSLSETPLERRRHWYDCGQTIFQTRSRLGLPLNRKILAQNLLSPWFA